MDVAGATDIGKVRRKNEDQYLIASLRRVIEIEESSIPTEGRLEFTRGASALLLLVADGVGGRKGGQEASSRTVDTIMRYVASSSIFFANPILYWAGVSKTDLMPVTKENPELARRP